MPQTTQPTSTALVIQALLALGLSPTAPSFAKGTATPVSTLLSFQLTSGTGRRRLLREDSGDNGDVCSPPTRPVPALAGLTLPFGPPAPATGRSPRTGACSPSERPASTARWAAKPLNPPIVGYHRRPPTARATGKSPPMVGSFAFGDAQPSTGRWAASRSTARSSACRYPGRTGLLGGRFRRRDLSPSETAAFYGSMGGKPLNKPIVGHHVDPGRQGLLGGRFRRRHSSPSETAAFDGPPMGGKPP